MAKVGGKRERIYNLFAIILILCVSSDLFFFLRAADWPTTNFLAMYWYFPLIQLVNFG